jgi:hypothetical protein
VGGEGIGPGVGLQNCNDRVSNLRADKGVLEERMR